MSTIGVSFRDRSREIDDYLKLLVLVDKENCELVFRKGKRSIKQAVSHDWIKTLKATSFLLLYNLVESTVRDVFTDLYERVANEGVTHSDVSKEFIEVWVEQEFRVLDKYSASPRSYHELTARLIHLVNKRESLKIPCDELPISGNLDAGVIAKLFNKHGMLFAIPPLARGGTELANIKRRRNDLAHGVLSFEECGRQITVAEILQIRRECGYYLKSLVQHVKKFSTERKYRRAS